MYIDFHVHAFTDSIAERAMAKLVSVADFPPYTNGTEADTRAKLTEWGIDYGVLLPIATKPTQQENINNWAAEVNHGNIISFGSVHPYAENAAEEVERIKALGLKGVKIHPDYQGVYLFDSAWDKVFEKCGELNLPVIIHMGFDPISPRERHAMPYDLAEAAKRFPKVKFIGAHMGGMFAWESVMKYLVGIKNVWLDTAFTVGMIDEKLALEIIRAHGADRVLFASDLPWHPSYMEKELVERLPLSDEEKDRIFYKNAAELLGLDI
ncbi:MAG: amidohydrolase family protein [Ruminiclostridium sp.]